MKFFLRYFPLFPAQGRVVDINRVPRCFHAACDFFSQSAAFAKQKTFYPMGRLQGLGHQFARGIGKLDFNFFFAGFVGRINKCLGVFRAALEPCQYLIRISHRGREPDTLEISGAIGPYPFQNRYEMIAPIAGGKGMNLIHNDILKMFKKPGRWHPAGYQHHLKGFRCGDQDFTGLF